MKLPPSALAGFAGLLALSVVLAAQSGGLRVHVYEAGGRTPLPGARVALSSARRLVAPVTVSADAEGRVAFPILPPGRGYVLEVSHPGYAKQRIGDLRVRLDDNEELSVYLSPEIRETVTVEAERGAVDLDRTSTSTSFPDSFIQDLPVPGRFYQNILALAPGVLDSDEDGNPNVHGARSRDFKTLVGGVSNVDPLTGERLSYVHPDSIQEIEIIPAGAGVEFSRAQGGFAQIIQKQGSNDFEGVLRFLYSSSRLDRGGATGLPKDRIPSYQWLQPSFQLSGPIVRDRLWFRLSHEHIDREDPVNVIGRVELTTRRQVISSDQVTWQLSPKNKLALHYDYDPLTLDNVGVSFRMPALSAQRHEFGGPTWKLVHTAAYSPRLLVESQVAYQDHEVNILPTRSGVLNECLDVRRMPALNGAQCFYENLNRFSGSHPLASRDNRQRLTVRTQMSAYGGSLFGMTHRLKLGFISENERYFRSLVQGPDAIFEYFVGLFGQRSGQASFRIPIPRASVAHITGMTWGLYAEDQVHPVPNISITLGARLDQESFYNPRSFMPFDPEAEVRQFLELAGSGLLPWQANSLAFTAHEDVLGLQRQMADALGIDNPDRAPLNNMARQSVYWSKKRRATDFRLRNTNVSPRISVAWDPSGKGKTKLGIAAGRYYDKIFLAVPLIELEPATTFFSIDAIPWPGRLDPFIAFGNPTDPGTINVRMVDRDLRTPFQDERSLSFEHEVGAEAALKLTYIERKFRDQFQDTEINRALGDLGRCMVNRRPDQPWVDVSQGPDGVLDDCVNGGDGAPDFYLQNPAWGDILLVGNFNTTRYKAVVLELVRRQYRGWQMESSYTWSKAIGDAEDFNQILGNDRTTVEDERGFLAFDQRHVFKLNASSVTPWGFRLGTTVQWESGLPYSVQAFASTQDALIPQQGGIAVPGARLRLVLPTHRRNDQRNPSFWTFDARIAKEWNLGRRGTNLSLTAEVFNLLNEDTIRILDQELDGTLNAVRRFGRRWQVGMQLAF